MDLRPDHLVRIALTVLLHLLLETIINGPNPQRERIMMTLDNGKNMKYYADSYYYKSLRNASISACELTSLYICMSQQIPLDGYDVIYVLVASLGWLLVVWSQTTLGMYFTMNLGTFPGHQLIKSGPYRYLMHPGLTGEFIFMLGYLFFLRFSFTSTVIILGNMFINMENRIYIEEEMLDQKFPPTTTDSYENYCQARGRFLPGLKYEKGPWKF